MATFEEMLGKLQQVSDTSQVQSTATQQVIAELEREQGELERLETREASDIGSQLGAALDDMRSADDQIRQLSDEINSYVETLR